MSFPSTPPIESWLLGFRPYRFHPGGQFSRVFLDSSFLLIALSQHATFPFRFPIQVGWATSEV